MKLTKPTLIITSISIFFVLSFILTFVYGLFFSSDPKEIPSALINQPAQSFQLTTFEGEVISLEQFRGKPVVLNFWASWCFACRNESLALNAAYKKYSQQGVVFIGIAINDAKENAMNFAKRFNKKYYLGLDDEIGTISLDYGVTAVPETFLIDPEGIIRHKQLGEISFPEIERFLQTKNVPTTN